MTGRRHISTGSPFEKSAAYSRAVVDGDWCFVAGTTGYDYDTMSMPESAGSQTENCLKTISKTLGEAGFTLKDVVRARYIVVDRADIDAVFAVLGKGFAGINPAATMIVCDLIRPEMKVEIEVTARRSKD